MLEQLYKRKESRQMTPISPYSEQLVFSPVVEDGNPIKLTELKKVCVEDNFKQFSARDFDVQSILSVGALHLLKPVTMRNNDVQSFADNVDMISSQLDKQINNETTEVQPQG